MVKPQLNIYLFFQVVHAISYCHQLHVVHRDLKPENVLMTNDYHLKIVREIKAIKMQID